MYLNEVLVMEFAGCGPETLSVAEILQGAEEILRMVDENINSKIAEIAHQLTGESESEVSGSIFDQYDEENGYNELETETEPDLFEIYSDNLKYMIQYCIRKMRMSFAECLHTDLVDLLDYLSYQIQFDQEEAEYRE